MQEVFGNVLKNNPRVYKIHRKFLNAIDNTENEKEWHILWNKNSWKKTKTDTFLNNLGIHNVNIEWID